MAERKGRGDEMTDTPRTDHAQWDSYVDVELARNLERELATAKAEVERLRDENDEDQSVINVWRGRTQRAEAEVERLRAVLERAAECGLRDEIHAALKETK